MKPIAIMHKYTSLFASAVLLLVAACVTKTNDPDQRTQNMAYYLGVGGNAKAKEHILKVIQGARGEVVAVFNDLSDTDVSSALIERANAGLKGGVAGDRRNEGSAGFVALKNLRSSNMFLDYFAATSAASLETNQNLKNKILATRLNFNGLNRSLKFNARPFDGRVEYNFVVADKYNCWISTGGANDTTFSTGASVVFVFQSFDICNDFYNEAQQLVYGGLFGDEGVPSFGKFRNNKTINDPNTRFRLGDLIFNIYFAPQEKPLAPVVTELMRAESSIKFAARALTQDVINDVASHQLNRSHVLNVFQYKSRIPQIFGKAFSVQGVIGSETDTSPTPIPSASTTPTGPWTPAHNAPYNTLVSGSCPTINTSPVNLPFNTGSYLSDPTGVQYNTGQINLTSIHCDLRSLQDSIANTAAFEARKYAGSIPFNVFLVDYGGRKPRIIVMSSDLRKRYYFDLGGSQEAEPKRTRDDFFSITDAFVMVIEPSGSATDMKIFDDFNSLVGKFFDAGGSL